MIHPLDRHDLHVLSPQRQILLGATELRGARRQLLLSELKVLDQVGDPVPQLLWIARFRDALQLCLELQGGGRGQGRRHGPVQVTDACRLGQGRWTGEGSRGKEDGHKQVGLQEKEGALESQPEAGDGGCMGITAGGTSRVAAICAGVYGMELTQRTSDTAEACTSSSVFLSWSREFSISFVARRSAFSRCRGEGEGGGGKEGEFIT